MKVFEIIKKTWVWLVVGLVLVVLGFAYDLIFAGLPYQDPSEEILKCWNLHGTIAGFVRMTGALIFLVGIILGLSKKRDGKPDKKDSRK
jgi:hypothetical protein